MSTPKQDEAERVQLWIALGQQPGVSAWFTVWRVVYSKRPRGTKTAAAKRSHDVCIA
ncbi:MAG TPA: hypothetical protein VGN70_03475 [Gammaproteobacteria bacterium]|jgi:hypothetical protein